jgi:voltage-gated potassium channel
MDERADRIAERFDRPLLIAAVLTIPVTILQLLPPADPWRTIADVLNWVIWLAFLAEIVIMLAVTSSRRRWLRGHLLDVAIVVLTPPFLVSIVQSVRLLRLLRLLRLIRLAPLIRRLFSTEGLQFAALLTLLTALAGGLAFASVENRSAGDGIYWAITTMTTVGYGDITPKTPEGKVIAITVMLVGIGSQRSSSEPSRNASPTGRFKRSNSQTKTSCSTSKRSPRASSTSSRHSPNASRVLPSTAESRPEAKCAVLRRLRSGANASSASEARARLSAPVDD